MNIKKSLLMLSTALVLTGPAYAQDMNNTDMDGTDQIVLSGVVSDVTDTEFDLTYNLENDDMINANKSASATSTITVSMNALDGFDNRNQVLNAGDRVVVAGDLDNIFFEARELDADSIYLIDDDAFYGESQTDLEPLTSYNRDNNNQRRDVSMMDDGSQISMTGIVQTRSDDEFTMNAGQQNIRVEMDDIFTHASKVSIGDRVHVIGHIDDDLFEGREVEADNVTVLSQNTR